MLIKYIFSATYVTSVSMEPTVTVTIGSSAVIVCNITLNTAIGPDLSVLNYYWYHNNIDITNNITNQRLLLILSIDGMSFTTTLKITLVQSSNAGVYRCSAGIVGGNTITSNTTQLCVKGIICFDYLSCLLFSLLVYEIDLLPVSAFQDLQLGKKFLNNCVLGSLTGLSISWWKNNTLLKNDNRLETPPLQPSDNNTIYTCIVSVQQNPSGCPHLRREYVILLKSEYF